MLSDPIFVLTVASSLASGVVGGTFFAFSAFVMKALARLPPAQGIAAMQSINITVVTPPFMLILFGTGVACLVLVNHALSEWSAPGAGYLLAGSILYVVGDIVVTIVFNVPRNNALAAVDPSHVSSIEPWQRYMKEWTAWNHVRTFSALAASALLTMSSFSS